MVPSGYRMLAISRKHSTDHDKRGGGVIAFIKTDIKVKLMKDLSSPDIMVIDCGSMILVNAYILPPTNRWLHWTDKQPEECLWELMHTLANIFTPEKPPMVFGDINARTANESTTDRFPRVSADKPVVTTRGRRLIDVCRKNNLAIINGTPIEMTSPGALTSFQPKIQGEERNAVVDYAIAHTDILSKMHALRISQPTANPEDEWSDHMAVVMEVSKSLVVREVRQRQANTHDGPPIAFEVTDPLLEQMCDMLLQQDSDRDFFGKVRVTSEIWTRVFVKGVCLDEGKPYARAGAGVFQSKYASTEGTRMDWQTNRAERVDGRQDKNRAGMVAILLGLQAVDRSTSVVIFTTSTYAIQRIVFDAPRTTSDLVENDEDRDIMQLVIQVMRDRHAPVRLQWMPETKDNQRMREAEANARRGAQKQQGWIPQVNKTDDREHTRTQQNPDRAIPGPKLSTNLKDRPEPPREENGEDEGRTEMEDTENENTEKRRPHRGRARLRQLQTGLRRQLMACETPAEFWRLIKSWTKKRPQASEITLEALTEEMRGRMNHPEVTPASFDVEALEENRARARLLPSTSPDTTSAKHFSRPFTMEEIDWAKQKVRRHTKSAAGIDQITYKEITEVPSEKIRQLFQACVDGNAAPGKWLVSVIIGIPKPGKDPKNTASYRLICLESCLLKMLMLLVDKRVREHLEAEKLIPETQNGFRPTYRTNNNPFILRCMAERALFEGKPLYVAYMDLKNAFPSVDRDTLWVKFDELKIAGPLIDWIKMVYERMSYTVRLDGRMSPIFKSFLGLLTGDPTSPGFWNIFLAAYTVREHKDDVKLNGKNVGKLEHADDISLGSTSAEGLQVKVDDTEIYTGKNGCENQLAKCVFSCHANRPGLHSHPPIMLGEHEMQEVKSFQYVGIHMSTDTKDMFQNQYKHAASKATTAMNACLAVDRIVDGLPVWEARTLYMARVDPYLSSGADVSLDITVANLKMLQDVQHSYIRRVLGLGNRSELAVLFSETGIVPIKYRRIQTALDYLKYLIKLPEDRLAKDALLDSLDLARNGAISWVNDLRLVLERLPIPVLWDITGDLTLDAVAKLSKEVAQSMDTEISAALDASPRLRDMLQDRYEIEKKRKVTKVCAFRHYLRVPHAAHRKALTHVVLSAHALAMERMRWAERGRPKVEAKWRLCRFCAVAQEDAIHALFVCPQPDVVQERRLFMAEVDKKYKDMKKHTNPREMFRDILSHRPLTSCLAKYCYEVLEIFYQTPMARIQQPNIAEVEVDNEE